MTPKHVWMGVAVTAIFLALDSSINGQLQSGAISLDPASPTLISRGRTPADVLSAPQLNLVLSGIQMGLLNTFPNGSFDNVSSLSFGETELTREFLFSVDRLSLGTSGSGVAVAGDSKAASIFRVDPAGQTNAIDTTPAQLNLMGGFLGDDVDGLIGPTVAGPGVLFFTLDSLSSSVMAPLGPSANDLLVKAALNSYQVFADGETTMNLQPQDEIDALVLIDRGQIGILDPGTDLALFSLSPFSPSTFTTSGQGYAAGVRGRLSPADVLQTDFLNSFSLFASAASFGLLPTDNLDALAVPEPAFGMAGVLLATGVCLLLIDVRRIARSSMQGESR